MKKSGFYIIFVIALFCASTAYGQDNTLAPDKLEKTRAIMAENSAAKENSAQPWRTEETSLSGAGMSMVKSLVLCIGIFLVGVALYKKFAMKGGTSSGRRIQILERTQLSSRTFLSLVEIDGKTVLLSCGPDRVSFAQSHVPSATCGHTDDFEKTLKAVCERKES